jgi:hypothetical protein
MTTLVFKTPGVLDLRALTTFGMSAKPNSTSPIGMFGTGLKYALAVMVRLGAEPVLHRHHATCSFHLRPVEFRGGAFDMIEMRHRRFEFAPNQSDELPFTTQLGATWEAWQAYRELEANTRDERGETYLTEDPVEGIADHTLIATDHPAMLEAHEQRGEIFLSELDDGDARVNYSRRESRHVYYRGMRAYDLRKPAQVTWNLQTEHELTEDRTLKYEFLIRSAVAEFVTRSDDEGLVDLVLSSPETAWEHDLDFSYAGSPSDTFRTVMARRGNHAPEPAQRYYAAYAAPQPVEPSLFDRFPRPWIANEFDIQDNLGRQILCAHDCVSDDDRGALLDGLVRFVNEAE